MRVVVRDVVPVARQRAEAFRAERRAIAMERAAAVGRRPGRPPLALAGVYRSAHAGTMAKLVRQIDADHVALWAIDRVVPALSAHTVGSGQAPYFHLINRLFDARPPAPEAYVGVVSDDIVLARGSVDDLLDHARAARLDLFQPGHTWSSHFADPLLLAHPGHVARLVPRLEARSMLFLAPGRLDLVAPFPPELGGAAPEVPFWAGRRRAGARLGVVDAVRMVRVDRALRDEIVDPAPPLGGSGRVALERLAELARRERWLRLGNRTICTQWSRRDGFPLPPAATATASEALEVGDVIDVRRVVEDVDKLLAQLRAAPAPRAPQSSGQRA